MPNRRQKLAQPLKNSAVIYIRVSSREQADEGFSLDSQLRELREYCSRNGLQPTREFVEVETAKRAGRREFLQMIDYVREERVGAIVFEKVDRAYRNPKDPIRLDELEGECGVQRHFAKEGMILHRRAKSHEKFVHAIKLAVAVNYIDNLSEEARKGMLEKARQGIYPSMAPIGYLNVSQGSRRGIAQDPERAPIIRRLFEEYARGGISLLQAGLLARSYGLRTRKGAPLHTSSVAWLFANPMYYGVVAWDGHHFPGTHEPIVSKDLWDRVQMVMHGHNNNPAGFGVKQFAYKGLFKCGHCGCAVTAENKKGRYVYYHCTGCRGKCPGKKVIHEEELTKQLAALLQGLRIEPPVLDWLKEALKESFAEHAELRNAAIAKHETDRQNLRSQLERLYTDKLSGEVSPGVYASLRAKWEADLASAEIAIRAFDAADRNYYDEGAALLDLASNAHLEFLAADAEDRRDLLRHIASNFSIVDGKVVADLRVSFKSMLEANQLARETPPDAINYEIWWPVLEGIRTELVA